MGQKYTYKYIKSSFFISNMHCKGTILYLNNFKGDFLNIAFFFAPSDSRYLNLNQILSYPNKPYIYGNLFIQLSYNAYILISKNWHLRLVLWSRVTFCHGTRSFLDATIVIFEVPDRE